MPRVLKKREEPTGMHYDFRTRRAAQRLAPRHILFGKRFSTARVPQSTRFMLQGAIGLPSSTLRSTVPAAASTMVGKVNIEQLKGLVLRKPV